MASAAWRTWMWSGCAPIPAGAHSSLATGVASFRAPSSASWSSGPTRRADRPRSWQGSSCELHEPVLEDRALRGRNGERPRMVDDGLAPPLPRRARGRVEPPLGYRELEDRLHDVLRHPLDVGVRLQ